MINPEFQKYIITPKLFNVYVDEELVMQFVNEYTIRNLQIAVKNKEVTGEVKIVTEDMTVHNITERGLIKPNFPKGYFSLSYDLAFQLMD